jgi:hypothetical protein
MDGFLEATSDNLSIAKEAGHGNFDAAAVSK